MAGSLTIRRAIDRGWLPAGGTLPAAAFEARHRTVIWLLWFHVLALPAFAFARGYPWYHGFVDTFPIFVCAVAATLHVFDNRGRACLGALGLVTCSAVFTHLWGGVTEAHFHFFVVVALLSLYEDWLPWGLACGFVLLHHGVMGAVDPASVYGAHTDAARHPWRWAGIHSGFIAALAGVNLVSWRSNDLARYVAGQSEERFRSAFDGAPEGMAIIDDAGVALRAPITLDGQPRFVTASVGLALAGGREPADASADAGALLQDADAAMYRAKELGKDRCAIFDDSMRASALERLELEGSLREALARGELHLDYQPQVALPGGELLGVEALLRWRHPRLGPVSPAAFVPIAERTGLIAEIGAWVLREACGQAVRWESETLDLAVNVSARLLERPDFAEVVRSVLTDSGLAPQRLCLEVTETVLLADADAARGMLAELKAIGVRVAVDDFGVGHASLRHLRELLRVDTLKVDKSFVDGIVDDPADAAIVESVVRLAAGLGLECVAEGVEHEAQADALAAMGCQAAQGFHFARPMAPDGIAALLARTVA